tara:strand:+ start:140 stop:358 length:219 start_codon:yes stop_codon:yes gene_type:complete
MVYGLFILLSWAGIDGIEKLKTFQSHRDCIETAKKMSAEDKYQIAKGFDFEVTNFGSMDKVKDFCAVVPKSE